jgi:hypothetical protein
MDTSVPMSLLAEHPNVQWNFYRNGLEHLSCIALKALIPIVETWLYIQNLACNSFQLPILTFIPTILAITSHLFLKIRPFYCSITA